MAFTAGSVELAKANKLGNQLAHLFSVFGTTGAAGTTGAKKIEKYAKKLGFGITGLTTGAGFPPFGTILPSYATGTEAALQNPRGETMASGITLGALEGQTVGIYLRKFVRSGADYKTDLTTGVTRGTSGIAGSTTEKYASGTQVNNGFTAAVYFNAPAGGSGTWVVS